MALLDEELSALLGEPMLARQVVTYLAGQESTPDTIPATGTTPALHRGALVRAVDAVMAVPATIMEHGMRGVTGTSLLGWQGSQAHALRDAITAHTLPEFVCTPSWLVLVGDDDQVCWSCGGSDVRLSLAARPGRPARFRVDLPDGSSLLPLGGLVSGRGIRRFIEVWQQTCQTPLGD